MRLFRSADLRNCASGASLLPDVCALAFLLVWILQLYWTSSVAQWVDYNAAVHLDLRNIWQVGESIALAAWCIVFFIRPKAPGFAVAAAEAAYGVDFNGDEEKIVAHLFKLYAEKVGE